MTLVAKFYPRGNPLRNIPMESRLFTVAPQTQLLGFCHWQHSRHSTGTVVLVHGLEGCCDSHYMAGLAAKAWQAGLNVIRLNQRTCGGTEHLASSLYNCGLSMDIRAVVTELSQVDGLESIALIGYSMGGNLILKMAGETEALPSLTGVFAVCPNIDPTQCIAALEHPTNRLYHDYFFKRLKARVIRKAALFPGKWDLTPLKSMKTVREFDEYYTAPDGGYGNAAQYYDLSGARHVLHKIQVPTVILTAQDDPFIPCSMFSIPAIAGNPFIDLVVTSSGGHCGFFQRRQSGEDYYWAENRLIEMISRRHPRHHDHLQAVSFEEAGMEGGMAP
ncbi:MAG TPA: alpha/beta fold hydrolase [Nitrospiraceae bacterium]|nr:alpha/beta fold hydrolase [Nitrospiraceae bacterium]